MPRTRPCLCPRLLLILTVLASPGAVGAPRALATGASWIVQPDVPNAWFGHSVATAGDVNGDGYSDAIVGAPLFDGGHPYEGLVRVYHGTATGLSLQPTWSAEGEQTDASFGWSVAPAGDVNGDGYADVIVGAWGSWNGEYQEGRAFVYHGSAGGLSATPDWVGEGNAALGAYGWSVASAGDVNGDGYADVIVGAIAQGSGGRVHVYHGSPDGLSATADWSADGTTASAQLGISVGTAGDVNGDGYADVIVGADGYRNGQFGEGGAFVFHGSASGLAATPAWVAEGDQEYARLGTSVSTAGDVNADGYADVIVGAPEYDNGQSNEGRAFVFLGGPGGLAASPAWSSEGNQTEARFGVSVATAGDVDGDGYADVIVGAERFDLEATDEGRAWVYFGGPAGPPPGAGWERGSGQAYAYFGKSVATAGDVNGDGYSDVIVGAYQLDVGQINEGHAFAFHGSGDGLRAIVGWSAAGEPDSASGAGAASAGDVNGDGYSDVIVGAAADTPTAVFHGSADGLPFAPSWSFVPGPAGAEEVVSVAGIGDVNGDGYADVAIGVAQTDTVLVFHGSSAGLSAEPAWTKTLAGGEFGREVAGAGDVNGDGYADLLVGDDAYTDGGPNVGAAFVWHGSAAGLGDEPAWVRSPYPASWRFGAAVAGAGDVNGDGYADVIVGAPDYDPFLFPEGAAYVYHGSAAGLSTDPDWTAIGIAIAGSESRFGVAVATAGDVNGDGYSDVIVGDDVHDSGALVAAGRAFVYHGSPTGLLSVAAWEAAGTEASGFFGNAVGSAGDVNGDGLSDIVIGAPFQGPFAEGRAHVALGTPEGLLPPGWAVQGNETSTYLGVAVGSAGDVNGDGFGDLLVGASGYDGMRGRADVYLGGGGDNPGRPLVQLRADGAAPVALGGRSDAEDAFGLRLQAATPAGRGKVRLEWQTAPLGVPFDGLEIRRSTTEDTGPPAVGEGSATPIETTADGLAEGTRYRWRVRIASDDPLFPRGPWRSLPGSNATEAKLRTAGCVDPDGDGWGDLADPSCAGPLADCDPAEPDVWATPGPVAGLRFDSAAAIVWDVPVAPGALASDLRYDVLRSTVAGDFSEGVCLAVPDDPQTAAIDPDLPPPGGAFHYLARPRNSCPDGVGPLGTDSGGAARLGPGCP